MKNLLNPAIPHLVARTQFVKSATVLAHVLAFPNTSAILMSAVNLNVSRTVIVLERKLAFAINVLTHVQEYVVRTPSAGF